MENYYKLDKCILSQDNLNASDKIIFSVISNLSQKNGYCWASNKQLGEITKINEKTIQRSINKLCEKSYIQKWKRRHGKIVYRFITTNEEIAKKDIKTIVEETKKFKYVEVMSVNEWLYED